MYLRIFSTLICIVLFGVLPSHVKAQPKDDTHIRVINDNDFDHANENILVLSECLPLVNDKVTLDLFLYADEWPEGRCKNPHVIAYTGDLDGSYTLLGDSGPITFPNQMPIQLTPWITVFQAPFSIDITPNMNNCVAPNCLDADFDFKLSVVTSNHLPVNCDAFPDHLFHGNLVNVITSLCCDEDPCDDWGKSSNNLNDSNKIQQFTASPNPFSDNLTIERTNSDDQLSYNIMSLVGKNVKKGSFGVNQKYLSINTSEWETGFYVINVFDKEGKVVFSEKVLKF